MRPRTITGIVFTTLFLTLGVAPSLGQPPQVSYQGELFKNGLPWDANASFKFAILTDGGITTLWSNDGSSSGGSEPSTSVVLPVDSGIFNVLLGAPPMVQITADLIEGVVQADLRVWVDTGDGFEQLADQPIASSLFALQSGSSGGPDTKIQLVSSERLADDGNTEVASIVAAVSNSEGMVSGLGLSVSTVVAPPGSAVVQLVNVDEWGTTGVYNIEIVPALGTWKQGRYLLLVGTTNATIRGVVALDIDL